MIRPNEGYDITAYKKGLFRYGYEKLLEYDEAFICNDTLFGPIHPFSEMFDAMAGRDLDFWGITAFHEVPFDPFGTVKYGYLPQHIQSFFQVFRKDFMKTADFLQKGFHEDCGLQGLVGKNACDRRLSAGNRDA